MSRKMIRTGFVALATCLSASSSGAAILHVPGDYATIQEAVDAAASGDRIEVSSVPVAEDVSVVDKDLQVVAVASPIVVRSFSWTNPNAVQTPIGGYVEGFDVTGDVTMNGLPLSFTATDLNVDGVIDIAAEASSEDTPVQVIRCTSLEGISAVGSGIGTPNVARVTISECETGGSITARSFVGRVEGCVVPNGSIRVFSRWGSDANDNVVTGGGIHLVGDAYLTANHNVVRGGGIVAGRASDLEAEHNSIFDCPVGIDFGGDLKGGGRFVGNLIVRC